MAQSQEVSPPGMAKLKRLRQLGNIDMYQLAMYMLDQYRGTSVSGRYVIPAYLAGSDARPRLVSTVEAAICDAVLQHPTLQVGIADADSRKPTWVQLESLDLDEHLTWRFLDRSSEFEDVLRETTMSQLDARFPDLEKRPGWKITLLHQEQTDFVEILFTWNHPHADGMSGKIFHETLLRSFDAARTSTAGRDAASRALALPASPPDLPPPIERAVKLPRDAGELGAGAHGVGGAALARVLAACRRRRTTLTGLLHVLALASLASRVARARAPGFQSLTAVNLRRFIPAPAPHRAMSNCVTLRTHEFGAAAVAAAVRANIARRLEAGVRNDQVGITKFVGDWQAQMRDTARRPRQCSWFVTNLGAIGARPQREEAEEEDGGEAEGDARAWALRRAQFAVSAETTQAAPMIATMTVAGEGLRVACSWQECIFDVALGDRVVADLERWLQQVAALPE
ncbi:hypothetical protein GGS23DRAFT_592849 [Durotheca rogersii]|uniref:uncharacterized protein n=1 Tax=Durotheca rogersii TaxID=419775 RepID=UPI00221E5B34|nr:uncharacterized protein GGS23DRAFT_592849 [Durotheca rogersii]KAI5867542.1 hypothetical protein GGS23DRAFT_592849 [Durotheca rogersii]